MSAKTSKIFDPKRLDAWVAEQEQKKDPPWLLKDLLQADSGIQVTGPATRGFKTWYAMACSLALASGKKIQLLEPLKQRAVLYLLQEGPAKPTADRFRKLERGLDLSIVDLPIYFCHRQHFYLDEEAATYEIANIANKHGVGLVVIDTLGRVNRGDENSAEDINKCLKGVNDIRNAVPDCSVMYLHHVGKPPSERGGPRDIDDESRGSSALAGAYDIHLAFRKKFDSQKHLDLTVRGNQLPERYYTVDWDVSDDKATFVMRETQPGEIPDGLADKLVNELMPERGYNQGELKNVWKLDGPQFKQILYKLVEEKTLEKRGSDYYLS